MTQKWIIRIPARIFFYILLPAVIFLSESCTNSRKKTSVAADENTPKQEVVKKVDSSEIFIFSLDGDTLRKITYALPENRNDEKYYRSIEGYPEEDTLTGDFNGDGKSEKAWVKDLGIENYFACKEDGSQKFCETTIEFSDKSIAPLVIDDFFPTWSFKNEGNLYSDGKDAIGFFPGWDAGACRVYLVFRYTGKKWVLACDPIPNSWNMREAGIVLIEKDPNQKGYALIREAVFNYSLEGKNNQPPPTYVQRSSCSWSNVVERSIKLR